MEDWGKLIGDIPSATAILDRFLHHAEIITITGRSYRLRNQGGKDGQSAENGQPSKDQLQRHEHNWLVLKRLPVAGFEAPSDTRRGPTATTTILPDTRV